MIVRHTKGNGKLHITEGTCYEVYENTHANGTDYYKIKDDLGEYSYYPTFYFETVKE